MKRVRFDPNLPTLSGDGRMTEGCGGLPTIQAQADRLLRHFAGEHAIEDLVSKTKFTQTYLLDDGSRLKINLKTMAVTRL